MSPSSRPGSTSRASASPRCGSCPTTRTRIVEAVNALRAGHDYLFTTGGIGPTHDDITVDAIAAALRRAGGRPSRGAGDPRGLLRDRPRRADRGAAADGAGARGRRADPQPDVGRAGHQDRQRLHPRRRAAHHREHARGADRDARGRPAGGVGDARRAGRPKARSPTCCARPRRRIRASRSAAIPFFKDGRYGANFVIRTDDGELARRRAAKRSRRGCGMPVMSRSTAGFEREPPVQLVRGRFFAKGAFVSASRCRNNFSMTRLERVAGIEPVRSAWEADRLPLHHTR